jgi:DNA-binding beta-propeller fold protein YncE
VLLSAALVLALPGSAVALGPLSSFGTFGEGGAGQIEKMRGVAIGADGSAYVADNGNFRIDVFAPDGTFLRAFGKDVNPGGGEVCTTATGCQMGLDGEGAGAMNGPHGVAFGPEGNLFVSDRKNNRIDVFAPDGTFLRAFGREVNPVGGNVCTTVCQAGAAGASAGALNEPRGLDVDASGSVFVSDYANQRIAVFTAAGTFLRAFGKGVKPGGGDVCTILCQPGLAGGDAGMMRLALDVAVGPGGQIVVADSANDRIDVFTSAGTFVRAFGKGVKPGGGDVCTIATGCKEGTEGTAAGTLKEPTGVRADATGNLYVTESSNSRVSKFTLDGTFIHAFGEGVDTGAAAFEICTVTSGCQAGVLGGKIAGATPEPHGLAVDCRGALYVTEELADFARVERFGEPGTPLSPCAELSAEGEPVKVSLVRVPSNGFRFAGLIRNRRNGSAVLFVRVPGPGKVILKGRGVRRLSRSALRATRVRLPIRPKVRLRQFLKRHGKGRIRVEVTFKPIGGTPFTREKPIVLKRKRG